MKKIVLAVTFLAGLGLQTVLQAKATNEQLVIGVSQEFEHLNPLNIDSVAIAYVSRMINRPLVSIDTHWNYFCHLCTQMPSFENGMVKKSAEQGKEKLLVTWELKPNAKWGDGKPLTGHDVKFSWEIGKSSNVMIAEKDYYTQIEEITVDPKNPQRFTMKFGEVKYNFYRLTNIGIVPQHIEKPIWEKTKTQTNAYEKASTYVGNPLNPGLYSGPYLVAELKLGSHVVLKPNPNFYGEKPKIQKIIFRFIPNTQALEAALQSGDIDMIAELGIHLDQALSLEKRAKPSDPFVIQIRDSVLFEHVDLNLRDPLLQDVKVRKALVYALDRDKLTLALFAGRQKKALHMIHPLDPNYTEDVVLYPYSLQKAMILLNEAGWKKGADGFRYKDGKRLEMTIMTTAQDKTRELVQVFLQSEWQKAGIKLNIKNVPARVFFGESLPKLNFNQMAMFAWATAPDDPVLPILHSSSIPKESNGWSGVNYPGWSNPKVDALVSGVLTEFDASKRKQMLRDVMVAYTDEVPVIPLYNRVDIAVVPKHLRNFQITGHLEYSVNSIEKWSLE